MRKVYLASAVLTAGLLLAAPSAHAGGLEYAGGQGAFALGRGGAVTARADDPMVLAYNPAGLAELRGTQFLFNANLALLDACVDPIGYYGWGVYSGGRASILTEHDTGRQQTVLANGQDPYYREKLDTVCLDQNVVPIPQFGWTLRLSERFGIGAGLIFPGVAPSGSWGGRNGIIHGENGDLRPAPTRYMLLRSSNIGVFPTIGFGYRLFKALRIGAAFEWGMINVNNFSMSSVGGGTLPKNDIIAHVKAQDWFIPAFTVSTHLVPFDALDVVLAFRWQDDLKAHGNLDTTTGIFAPDLYPRTTGDYEITSLTQHFPWKLRAGIRYADRLAPRPVGTGSTEADAADPDRIHDPLQDEHWDIEFDAEYQNNGVNDKQVLLYPLQDVEFMSRTATMPSINMGPTRTEIEKHWKNQISLRAGGTFNFLPGVFGVSAGAHYENRGVDPAYMQVDLWPVQRIGVHSGIIVRVAKSIDLVFSYGHIFQETLTVEPPPHQDRNEVASCWAGMPAEGTTCYAPAGKIGAIDKSVGAIGADRKPPPVLEEAPHGKGDATAKLQQQPTITAAGQPPYIVNSGRYRSNFDIIALGVNAHF